MELSLDPKPTVLTLLGRQQGYDHSPDLTKQRKAEA
jgi:hypothetical protein